MPQQSHRSPVNEIQERYRGGVNEQLAPLEFLDAIPLDIEENVFSFPFVMGEYISGSSTSTLSFKKLISFASPMMHACSMSTDVASSATVPVDNCTISSS